MKCKRRKAPEAPPKIRSFIDSVTSSSLENIEEPLKCFVWEFDKGDFHHWDDLFNHFDSFFEKYIRSRRDLQIENDPQEVCPPFPREAVLQILRVTRIILENCANKHFYSSYEHLSLLLASSDADVVEATLQTLTTFLNKTVGKCSIRDASLTSKLVAFSQGWGSKEEGLGLVACSLKNGCDLVTSDLGSTLHFEFYAGCDPSNDSIAVGNMNQGLQVIHLPDMSLHGENGLELFCKLVREHNVPPRFRFPLLTRLQFARAFGSITLRHQYTCIRLLAFIVLVQTNSEVDDLSTYLNNEPEFISELVSLLSFEDEIPEKIRILAIMSLVALCQGSHTSTVLTSVTSGSNRGILPSLMHKAVDAVTNNSAKWSIVFVEALLSLVNGLVVSTPGSLALREAGLIPTILPLLKDSHPQHLNLVTTTVHIVEGFLDYNNPAATLFRDLGGLDDTIARLKVEVSFVEKGSEETSEPSKDKEIASTSSPLETQPILSETLLSYQRRLLLKALLRAISLAAFAPGSSARIGGSEESILPHCLYIIFRRAKDFGGGVFSLAAIVMSDLIQRDPTCFPILDAAGLPGAFLDAILDSDLCSSEAVKCIPQCLDALCLNNTGLQLVRDRNALRCFVKFFTSRSYTRALTGDTVENLSTGLDELMRHASSLRASGVDMLVEILNTVSKIGSVSEFSPTDSMSSSTSVAMEIDQKETKSASLDEVSIVGSSNQMVDESSDLLSVSLESFLLDCITNVARLLHSILQNADACRIFIEKKGIEAVLKLFTLPLMPISMSIGQSLSAAFKKFSAAHSSALSKAICSFIREHLKFTNELLGSVCGAKLAEIECKKQDEVLKCLSGLEGLVSLSNFLLKGTSTMVSELGSSDADVLAELGKVYKEILWQISLSSDTKVDEKQDTDQEAGTRDAPVSSVAVRESDDDRNIVPEVRHMNPVSIRNTPSSLWNLDRDFVSMARSTFTMHRHGRHGFSRVRGSRISRQMDISHTDSDDSISPLDYTFFLETKKKSLDVLISELLSKLSFAIRSFNGTLTKALLPRRTTSLTPSSKSVATALAKFFYDALTYSGHSTDGFEMSLSVKCRYLGKVVDDIAAVTFDSRRRVCNTAIVNSFYVNGTFKELLTTYEATSQLLWNLPFSLPTSGTVKEISHNGNKVSHSSWLLDTLGSYCRLLECHVNSSLLLTPTSSSQSQTELLVQPVAAGLSIGLFSIPRDPEQFVRMLQSQVLDVILPVWNHPMFYQCSPTFISSVISIVTRIYSGVGGLKHEHSSIAGSTGQRLTGPPLDESTITTIIEMGFTRARAEEALRSVRTNSVELATDWLFSHPEEPVQEDVQLAQALALSLGNSSETSKEDINDEPKAVLMEDIGVETPPLDDILSTSVKLFQSSDWLAFPLTDLLLTLCKRNKGEGRPRVTLYLIQQLKLCPSDFSEDTGALCPISHVLALLLRQDSDTREIAAVNGLVSVVLDILANFRVRNGSKNEVSVTKAVSALLLILDNMLQPKPKVQTEDVDGSIKPFDPSGVDLSLELPSVTADKIPEEDGLQKVPESVFEKILGKPTGYLTCDESNRALVFACNFIKQHVPSVVMQAVLQLTARLTKTHALATQFLESGGLTALFSLPRDCIFPGFDSFASSIIRHLLEDPQTLQAAMELEIRQTLLGTLNRYAGNLSPQVFLTSMAPVLSRDPAIFMRAAAAVCQLESSGGRMHVVLSKEKEKDKEKVKASVIENGIHSSIRMSENKTSDTPGKCPKSHKRVPASLSQVIDQLSEIIMSFPSPENPEEFADSSTPMELDEPLTTEKGKSKVDERKMEIDSFSEKSAYLAKVSFVLKLMSDILIMYVHAIGVLLRRDSETCQKGCGQAGGTGHGGILHHILHQLLPLSSEKTTETSDEWRHKLSEKASYFLVVLCGRSTEGRRRVICEIVKTFASLSNSENNSKSILPPDKKLLAFASLVNSILSKNNSSSNVVGPGCSPDIAKTMIDGGMVQPLSCILQVIDLDHPDAPKVVNIILKVLEHLTRAANSSEQVNKEALSKKRSTQEIGESQTNAGTENSDHDRNTNLEHESTNVVQDEEHQIQGSPHVGQDHDGNQYQTMEQDLREDREENAATNSAIEEGAEFMREDMGLGSALQSTDELTLDFRIEHRTDDIGDEDDEDMAEDGEDDDEEDDEDDDEDIAEERAALMSLADTDLDDHDDNSVVDEYNDDMIDEDDFPDDHVFELRLREGFAGRVRMLQPGDANGLIDFAAEPFQTINTDVLLRRHRPLGIERRRQSGSRASLDRSGPDGTSFPHPLLIRPSHSGEPITLIAGSSSRDLDSFPFGSLDITQVMYDGGLPSEHTVASIAGDRLVGAAPPPLFELSHGINSLRMSGRRGGDSRWTDDGQPQTGGYAAAIARAVEDHFISQLHGVASVTEPPGLERTEHSAGQGNQQSPNDNIQAPVGVDSMYTEPSEVQNLERMPISVHQQGNLDINSCPDLSHEVTNTRSVVGAEDGLVAPEGCHATLNVVHRGSESINIGDEPDPTGVSLDTVPSSADQQNVDAQTQDDSEVHVIPSNTEFQNLCRDGPSGSESRSTSNALIESGSTMPDSSDNTGPAHANVELDMNDTDIVMNQLESSIPASYNREESSVREGAEVPLESNEADQLNMSEASNGNAIDPTFLEALPEDLRAEVLASQQAQSTQTATYAPPPAEEIDPEFLAALPPDIQAEVLAQQRAQRAVNSQQGTGQPVDMDNASIIATFPPELREEVLLTSSEAVLSALPSALHAEAQMLRDRAASHYHARTSMFGGSPRFGGRRLGVGRQTVLNRGAGVTIGERAVSAIGNSLNVNDIEGMPLLDKTTLNALIRLLRLAQPLGKGLLQRLLLNLCANSVTRATLVGLLVDMIRPEAEISSRSTALTSHRLYGCRWNVVYSRTQPSDGLPPLVSRRVLEILTYLATNHSAVADNLFYLDRSLTTQFQTITASENKKGKGKEKIEVAKSSVDVMETSQVGDIPLILFLKLLNRPLFLRSSAHLEQVMGLLQVVVNNAVAQIDGLLSEQAVDSSVAQLTDDVPSDTQKDSTSDQNPVLETGHTPIGEVPSCGAKKSIKPYDILSKIPEPDLQNLCTLLAQEGLSDKVYSLAAEILKKLAIVAASRRKFFAFELAGLAQGLSASAVGELATLRSMHMLGLTVGSTAGAAILRVLQALSVLTSIGGNKVEDFCGENEEKTILLNLNASLEPLWQELSDCITATETKLGQISSFTPPVPVTDAGDIVGGYSSLSPPLPPGTQLLLPFIEAFFVLCEKLQTNQTITMNDSNVTAREIKECVGSSSSPSRGTGGLTFARIAEKHRRLLNVFIRQNPILLEKSLSMMLKVPRLIDFDNKRAYFRSRIRKQHDLHPSAPLRISVRRAYVLEDSYNQLRLRPTPDLKGRLTVQFQGEEGIDAGGLTREWYQLLSRVIFDKGALLFTTVGNNATFQPNPNSVYQTEHLSYFKYVGRVVAKALFDGQLLDVYFTRSFYKHILGVKVTYHDIEAVDPDYYKNLKWMLENNVNDIPDLTFSMDADEEKHILYEKTEVTDYELIPGGRNIKVTEETKHDYVDLVAEHILTTAIRPQINSFLEGFNELVPRDLISIFNDKELELLISGLPEIDLDDLKANTEYTGYTAASCIIHWFWDVVKAFNKEDMARFLQFVTGTSKVPLEGFKALQGISGPQRFQIHKAYGAPERLPSAHTCFNQLDLPEYPSKEQLEDRLMLAIHEASEGFGFG